MGRRTGVVVLRDPGADLVRESATTRDRIAEQAACAVGDELDASVVVASGGVTLAAATKKTLTLTINSTGRALLSKFGKLKAIVTVSSGGKTIKTVTVTVLKAEKPKKKKK